MCIRDSCWGSDRKKVAELVNSEDVGMDEVLELIASGKATP